MWRGAVRRLIIGLSDAIARLKRAQQTCFTIFLNARKERMERGGQESEFTALLDRADLKKLFCRSNNKSFST